MSAGQTTGWSQLRLWAAHLLVLCFTLRALIPVGFMPSISAADGTLQVVICSAQGVKTLTIPLGDESSHKQGGGAQDICPFAAASVAAAAPSPLVVSAALEFAPFTAPAAFADVVEVRQAGPILGSRGPPV